MLNIILKKCIVLKNDNCTEFYCADFSCFVGREDVNHKCRNVNWYIIRVFVSNFKLFIAFFRAFRAPSPL
jgi:hypothetical protein